MAGRPIRIKNMNKLTIKKNPAKKEQYKRGDLFQDNSYEDEGHIYVLTNISHAEKDEWICVSLNTGEVWNFAVDNIKEATDGLVFFGRNCKIAVEAD